MASALRTEVYGLKNKHDFEEDAILAPHRSRISTIFVRCQISFLLSWCFWEWKIRTVYSSSRLDLADWMRQRSQLICTAKAFTYFREFVKVKTQVREGSVLWATASRHRRDMKKVVSTMKRRVLVNLHAFLTVNEFRAPEDWRFINKVFSAFARQCRRQGHLQRFLHKFWLQTERSIRRRCMDIWKK